MAFLIGGARLCNLTRVTARQRVTIILGYGTAVANVRSLGRPLHRYTRVYGAERPEAGFCGHEAIGSK